MATIRRRILAAIADILGTADGWTARVRRPLEDTAATKVAVVYHTSERKRQASGGCSEWTCDLSVAIAIDVDSVAIDPDADGFDVLDECIAELERVLPSDSDPSAVLGIASVLDFALTGHTVHLPSEEIGTMQASLNIDVKYRHDAGDPSTFGGVA